MKLRSALICSALMLLSPAAAGAMALEIPGNAAELSQVHESAGSYFVPTEPFTEGPVPGITAEGAISHTSWRVPGAAMSTLQLMAPIREQLEREGFELLFECESRVCGGFDFRYALDVLPEPEMHVNLGDYRYLAARRIVDGKPEYVVLIVSRSANAGFIQLTRISATGTEPTVTTSTKAPPPMTLAAGPVGEQLEAKGHATLNDLYFKTGKAELEDEKFASLADLAEYLNKRPDRTVVLVGHTDSEGSLQNNVALSKRRAEAVRKRLIAEHGVNPAQVAADGVGFLSPVASNLTEEGRARNRRVEVILTSTQ